MLRRLQKLDSTFLDIQEAVIEGEAHRLLITGISGDAVAEQLAYSSRTSLARMLKRRTGKTLSQLRVPTNSPPHNCFLT